MKSFKDFMKHPNCGTPDCCQQCKKEETELEEMFYTKKIYQAKGKPAQWAIIPKGQVKPVKVVNSEEEANYRARMMSVKKSKDE